MNDYDMRKTKRKSSDVQLPPTAQLSRLHTRHHPLSVSDQTWRLLGRGFLYLWMGTAFTIQHLKGHGLYISNASTSVFYLPKIASTGKEIKFMFPFWISKIPSLLVVPLQTSANPDFFNSAMYSTIFFPPSPTDALTFCEKMSSISPLRGEINRQFLGNLAIKLKYGNRGTSLEFLPIFSFHWQQVSESVKYDSDQHYPSLCRSSERRWNWQFDEMGITFLLVLLLLRLSKEGGRLSSLSSVLSLPSPPLSALRVSQARVSIWVENFRLWWKMCRFWKMAEVSPTHMKRGTWNEAS